MGLILTRSPFHISRGNLDSGAGLSVEISQYVDGVATILETYNLSFRNSNSIDISSLIAGEFTNNGDILKVETTISGTIDGVAQSDAISVYYSTNGYLYSSDDMNEDLSDDLRTNAYYAGSSDTIYKLKEASLVVPLLNTSLTGLMSNNVGNPAFDSATDWSIRPLDVIEDGVLKCGGEFGARNYLGFTPATGTDYKIKFEISNYVSGSIAFFSGSGGTNISGFVSANGTYEFNYTQDATSTNLFSLYSASGFEGHIDNVFLGERDSNNFEQITIDAKNNGSVVGTQTVEFDADTNTTSQQAVFNIDDIDEVLITTDYATKTIKVNTTTECKFSPYILTFKNRLGVNEDLWFFKKSTREMKVNSTDFKSNQLSNRIAGNLTRQIQEYNKNGVDSLSLNSGFVSEELNESFKQLMLSEEVQLYDFDNSTTRAVKISDSSLRIKTSVNDKLINYTIEVEFSNNIIDDVI